MKIWFLCGQTSAILIYNLLVQSLFIPYMCNTNFILMYNFFHKAFVKWKMSEVAKIEGRVWYAAYKKTIKVMSMSTDSLDDLKAQVNAYFVHLGENQHTRHLFAQMPCINLGEDRDEYAWKTVSYMPWLIQDDRDVGFMFRYMVENNILYMFVCTICKCVDCEGKKNTRKGVELCWFFLLFLLLKSLVKSS